MEQKQQALKDIKKIAEDNELTLADISKVLKGKGEKPSEVRMIEVSELLAYIGGILIFAGIGVYTTTFWQDLSSVVRVALTFGSGFVCYCIALGLSSNPKYSKGVLALLLIAALLQPTGLYVLLDEVYGGSLNVSLGILFAFGIMFVQQFATFWRLRLNLLLFLTIFFGAGFIFALLDYMEIKVEFIEMGLGIALLFITYLLDSRGYQPLIGFWYFIANAMFLLGAYTWLYMKPFEVVFVALCALTIYLSTLVKSKALLFTSTLGLLGYIGHYTMMNFVDSIGWPISLIVVGVAFIVLSGFALKLKTRYM